MGLLDVFRRRRGSPSGEQVATPLEAAEAVRQAIRNGNYVEALELAEKSLERFPWSEAVQASFRLLKRTTMSEEVAELKRECETRPDPAAFTRLAGAYQEIGEYDKAVEICRRAIERYPEHEGPWYVLARIRLERFREDWLPRDAVLAIQYYEKAFDLNRTSYRTLIDLAELYLEIGARRNAIRRAEAILYFAPEDERALAVVQKAHALPAAGREDIEELVAAYAEAQRKAMSRRGRRADEAPPPDVHLLREPERLQAKLHWLREAVDGFQAAIGLDATGRSLAFTAIESRAQEEMAEALHQIFGVAFDCSLRMDIGRLRRGVFEAPSGTVHLIQFGELRIGILCGPGSSSERVEGALERFLEDEIYRN